MPEVEIPCINKVFTLPYLTLPYFIYLNVKQIQVVGLRSTINRDFIRLFALFLI